mmetsp:Transcript_57565/g.64384  ORF Transcript_57565/g.64384 Transcript_57565/m.64384 type:complete len:417 (+) Transcript_57565:189-1439(+)
MDFLSLIPSNVPVLANGHSGSTAVTYSCTMTNLWSKETHPVGYESIANNAHWSPPVLVAHSPNYELWAKDTMASPGIEMLAETGVTSTLEDELQNTNSVGEFVVGQDQYNANDGPQLFDDIQVTSNFPMLSTITMAAPSPDWFTGISNFSPIDREEQAWYESFEIATYPWDAGTEVGDTYSLDNAPQEPHVPIFQLTKETIPSDRSGTEVRPMAVWSCTLQKTAEQEITIPVVNEVVTANDNENVNDNLNENESVNGNENENEDENEDVKEDVDEGVNEDENENVNESENVTEDVNEFVDENENENENDNDNDNDNESVNNGIVNIIVTSSCTKYFRDCVSDGECCTGSCRDGICQARLRRPERYKVQSLRVSSRVSSRSGTTMGGAAGKARQRASGTGTTGFVRTRILRGDRIIS